MDIRRHGWQLERTPQRLLLRRQLGLFMTRPVIIATMALLAAIGVVQVPMGWKAGPLPLLPANGDGGTSEVTGSADVPQAPPAPRSVVTEAGPMQPVAPGATPASALPPPPRNGDVPHDRQGSPPDRPVVLAPWPDSASRAVRKSESAPIPGSGSWRDAAPSRPGRVSKSKIARAAATPRVITASAPGPRAAPPPRVAPQARYQ